MWQDKCKAVYEFRDGRMLVVTRDDYRFDDQRVVILDSKTAQLALSNNANWKTINGSHVLIGKGGKIVAGMGGKYQSIPLNSGSNAVISQSFKAKLKESDCKAIADLIDNCDDDIKTIWNKYGEDFLIEDVYARQSAYYTNGHRIHINVVKERESATPWSSLMHECGHALDFMLFADKESGYGCHFAARYNNGEFQKTLIKESRAYINNFRKELSNKEGRKVGLAETRKVLADKLGGSAYKSVSDILGGATGGQFTGYHGHSKAYWKEHDVAEEAFANMFEGSIADSKAMANIKAVFPESYKVFKQMIKEGIA